MKLAAPLQGLRALFASQRRIGRPLLEAAELLRLRQLAAHMRGQPFTLPDSQLAQLGEQLSPLQGSGMDFDESRPYVAGDDRRFINWRLLARTGELYLKLFHEERRSQLFIVLDRRASMRMGTRDRLKVTQAARLATLLSCYAHGQQMAVGAVLMEEGLAWHRPGQGERALHSLLQACIAPAPPLDEVEQVAWQEVLSPLQGQLTPGSVVVLISDFADLGEEHEAALWALERDHRLIALRISDPLEHALPEQSLRFRTPGEEPYIELNGADPRQAAAYEQAMQAHHQGIEARLGRLGLAFYHYSTAEPIEGAWLAEGRDGR